MIRKDREITDIQEIEEIINKAKIIRVAMCENNKPYVVPLSFGYKEKSVYIHSSKKGRKIEALKKNNNVTFELDIDTELVESEKACDYSMKFKSVIGFGKTYFISDLKQKKLALDIIMSHYSKGDFFYTPEQIERTCLIRIDIESMTGKKS